MIRQNGQPLRLIFTLLLLGMLLSACGGDSEDDAPGTTPPPNITPTVSPSATDSPALAELRRQYGEIDAARIAIARVWEGLATGEQMRCGDFPSVTPPENINDGGDPALTLLAEELRSAASATEQAINLWRAECQQPRQNIPPDVINEGRLAVRGAGDALTAAADYLPQDAPQDE